MVCGIPAAAVARRAAPLSREQGATRHVLHHQSNVLDRRRPVPLPLTPPQAGASQGDPVFAGRREPSSTDARLLTEALLPHADEHLDRSVGRLVDNVEAKQRRTLHEVRAAIPFRRGKIEVCVAIDLMDDTLIEQRELRVLD